MGNKKIKLSVYVSFVLCSVHICIAFDPVDNYLIDCGSPSNTTLDDDARVFVSDNSVSYNLSITQNVTVSANLNPNSSIYGLLLYRTARILTGPSLYTFPIRRHGRHWIRLYFFPFVTENYDLTTARFTVSAQEFVLLESFQVQNQFVRKEYSVNVTSGILVIKFTPSENSFAFVNAIEVVSVPDDLVSNAKLVVNPPDSRPIISKQALETVYRVNMGGPLVTPSSDSLGRTWVPDQSHNGLEDFYNGSITYPNGSAARESAPDIVYATGLELNPRNDPNIQANMTWEFPVDPGFLYFIRMHFCNIFDGSYSSWNIYFTAYINIWDTADISNLTLGEAYYRDFITSVGDRSSNIRISVGPPAISNDVFFNAILNGLEIMKMNNSEGSLAVAVSSNQGGSRNNFGFILGSVIGGFVILILSVVLFMMLRRRKRDKKRHSENLAPLSMYGGNCQRLGTTFSDGIAATTTSISICKNLNLGFCFSIVELREATNSFDENLVIGIGGFGKVYKGILREGLKVAVKRGNTGSQEGVQQFRTEVEMLSKIRHRHLVSLIGYCNESNEMILVYEYMENRTLKAHLYDSDLPNLNWRQRLEICIGSARGLHYLHTGPTKAIIHRDVKSANILLDENLMAKVADFGLSKSGPDFDKTHVTTAVKGSFGYLDPEYFQRQKLTEKSDVYSFGVVLLEILCARPVIDPSLPKEMVNMVDWAMEWKKKGQLEQIIDRRLVGDIKLDSLRKFIETASKCLGDYGVDRPTMGDVLWNLEYTLQLQERGMQNHHDTDGANWMGETQRIDDVDSSQSFIDGRYGMSSEVDLSNVSMSRVFWQMAKVEAEQSFLAGGKG